MSPSPPLAKALPFHEPTITQILIITSFLLILNVSSFLLDWLTYCGLVGQVFTGVIWGTPLAAWLSADLQTAVVQLGYLGLILLVYEGGLNTSLKPLLANLPLSIAVAATGIALPIALSFVLAPLAGASSLQCFAAGAAMSATSLGTTFTILSSAGFANTRLGVVLTSAAMMDDVIGLVMIQVVATMGRSGGAVSGEAVGRPVGASFGLLIAVLAGGWGLKKTVGTKDFGSFLAGKYGKFGLHTGLLLGLVVAASFAGASVLFAAFLAGAAVGWWDGERVLGDGEREGETWTGIAIYNCYYHSVVSQILAPFFFASVGFSIPITQMFAGTTVWKGLVYSLLMFAGKLATGVWLLRFSLPFSDKLWTIRKLGFAEKPRTVSTNSNPTHQDKPEWAGNTTAIATPDLPVSTKPPRSLYPPSILGLAMVARGEVAFLIASVADAEGIFDGGEGGLYLVVMWAAMLCTVVGPMGVGALVRRVKGLEKKRLAEGGRAEGVGVLGVWGVGT
ncbi:Sodium/hydrogen exchanger family-domain-containing protein [Geopyxis carbonaria]|nr:Sodium/hydrogen exchanger family-domain-containing protein [Geopyxis carbonaria]